MGSNPYVDYYANQAGSGIPGYQGARFQRGQGFFGNVFRSAILPLLKYLGKSAVSTGAQVATDALTGENVLQSLKTRGKAAAQNIASDASNRAMRFAQTGTGRRRKRKKPKKVKKNKTKRKTKSKPIFGSGRKRRGSKRSKIESNNFSIF